MAVPLKIENGKRRVFYVGAGAVMVTAGGGAANAPALTVYLGADVKVQGTVIDAFPLGSGAALKGKELTVAALLTVHNVGGPPALYVTVAPNDHGNAEHYVVPFTGADGDTNLATLHFDFV